MSPIREQICRYNLGHLVPGEPPMTQRRLAGLTGMAETTVHRHATGKTSISLEQALAYARALKCSLEDLVKEPENAAA
jgi:DNA-binding XRE family transcriptional regulator